MEGFTLVLVLSATMFIGSYVAGYIPLAVSMSESRIRLLSIIGAGLLIGTALSVILPEGLEALQSSPSGHAHHESAHAAKVLLQEDSSPKEVLRIVPQNAELNSNLLNSKNNELNDILQRKTREANPNEEPSIKDLKDPHEHLHEHLHGYESQHESHDRSIGLSLLSGFLFMLVVDQITRSSAKTGRHKITATIGLVVHAAADGIAMGSASAINKSEIQFIVFAAIMLHKAPASFGLVSFLLMEGLEKTKVKSHLMVFSSAAPLATIVTYYILSGATPDGSNTSTSTTGLLMLFSAGTFLYVAAVHVLPELLNSGKDYTLISQNPATSGHSHTGNAAHFTLKEMAAIIFGAVLPLLLSSGHSH